MRVVRKLSRGIQSIQNDRIQNFRNTLQFSNFMKKETRDFTGSKFIRLTIIKQYIKNFQTVADCVCDCGNRKTILLSHILKGKITSCTCLHKEGVRKINYSHGDCKSREYRIWNLMKSRCSVNSELYKAWFGRGIKVCDRWLNSYENFLFDMGRSPSKNHSIDRIDNNGDYEPSNCRWATRKEQSRNTSQNINITHNGVTKCVSDWANDLGNKKRGVLAYRLKAGWSFHDAITKPIRLIRDTK